MEETSVKVEAARERLAENEEILKLIEPGDRLDEIIGKVSEDYYASRQEIIYQAYNSVKNVDTEAVSAGHVMVYYFDEKTGWAYCCTDELINVLGCNNIGEYFSLVVSPNYYCDDEIKSCDRSMMTVAPNAFVDIASDEVIRSLIDTFKSRMDENPSIAIDEGILVNNGYIPIINSNEKMLSK